MGKAFVSRKPDVACIVPGNGIDLGAGYPIYGHEPAVVEPGQSMTCKHPDAPDMILVHGLHHVIRQSIGFTEYGGFSFLPSRQTVASGHPSAAICRRDYGINVIAGQTLFRRNSSDGEFSKPIKSPSSGHPDIPFTILKKACDDVA